MKISIVTVSYNSASTIEDTLTSVVNQSHRDIEHIIIDGGSTDGTLDIVNRYISRISHIISEPDNGLYDAMNKGIGIAEGDIVGLINSDDFYANNQVLQKVSDFLSDNPDIDACYGDLCYVRNNDVSKIVRYWRSGPFQRGLFSKGWVPPHPTLFVRREIFHRYGAFDVSYRIAADFELMLRYFETFQIKVTYLPGIMVMMRLGGTSNQSLKNIILQNLEIRRALRSHNVSSSLAKFVTHKGVSRFSQFFRRPPEKPVY